MRNHGKVAGASLMFVVAAACGGDDPTFSDAAVHDGALDDAALDGSTPPDAVPTGPITVTTHARENTSTPGPSAGIEVYVITADGTLADTATTAADGTATVDVTFGDSVTAVYPASNGADLITVVQVEPGDSLTFGDQFTGPG